MLELLQRLIATPSFSKDEGATADIIEHLLRDAGAVVERYGNNVVSWHVGARHAVPLHAVPVHAIPTILLNSHHDTVKSGAGWSNDPLVPVVSDGKLYGLGSNDAGAALVMMLSAYLHFLARTDLPVNLCFAATAEEEISGENGMSMLSRDVFTERPIDVAIIGEPTGMQMAVAEKGLMVLDCVAHGRTGHAARNEGVNALYAALTDVEWFRTHRFERTSPVLGNVKMTVTQIDAGSQHNVVPDKCHFVVDVRVTDVYTNAEVLEEIRRHVACEVTPRSMRLAPSSIPLDHPIVRAGIDMGLSTYGSPTMSDQSLLPVGVPSMKIGPGDSARSHTPDEWIGLKELEDGITTFIALLENTMRRMS
ncbi:MAG: M20 family metallo-hydrolase [Candidatus Kapabacteria bacterium]|nr:M20 family metallo-hydrolase [Candidatus Kapabacteria bacterium]